MVSIPTANGRVTYTVLIPTRGRPTMLHRSLKKMPWLNDAGTVIGVHEGDIPQYRPVMKEFRAMRWIKIKNSTGSVAVAREQLRMYAMLEVAADYYVVTDDNAVHGSENSIRNLVRCCAEYRDTVNQPVIMAGMHNTAIHFDRGKIKHARTINGLRSYPAVAMIFQTYPHDVYEKYTYPADAYGLDDRHFFLWCIATGITEFRVCMDAPFTKSRYQEGGQGSIRERMVKTGHAIARLALDFPALVGATGTLRIPWQFLLTMGRDGTADRLVGGAMRKEADIVRTGTPIKVRRVTTVTGGQS